MNQKIKMNELELKEVKKEVKEPLKKDASSR
jgi:hypothetical protein